MSSVREPQQHYRPYSISAGATKPMPTVASALAQHSPYCFFNTSPEHSITGIPQSPTLLRLRERSFCLKVQVSGGPQARCLTQLPAWRSMHWLS